MLSPAQHKALGEILGPQGYTVEPAELKAASYDAFITEATPDVLATPADTETIARLMAYCHQESIPVTPRGAGTNLSGGSVPMAGGVVLCTSRMNRILEINTADRYVVCQPGVVNLNLQKALAPHGFFYPPDPSSYGVSTIGGNIAENAGGPRCLKYGVTRDYVMSLEVVLANGQVARLGSPNVKDVTGYNLTPLFCGSEGTLGVITEATLKVVPLPKSQRTVMAFFDDLADPSRAVAAIIGQGIIPAALELMDHVFINVVEDASHLGLPRERQAMLIAEVDGHPAAVAAEAQAVESILLAHGGQDLTSADTPAERDRLWAGRRAAYGCIARLAPTVVVEDATVPVSQVPAMVAGVQEIAARHGLKVGIVGHAGDGNLHPTIATDRSDAAQWEKVEAASREMFALAASLKGTLSGEHGIGLAKKEFLPLVMDGTSRELMGRIKMALDPKGILNPGKFV